MRILQAIDLKKYYGTEPNITAHRRNARNVDAHTLHRMKIHWIHGSVLRCGHSQHLDGRIRQKIWITSIRQMCW